MRKGAKGALKRKETVSESSTSTPARRAASSACSAQCAIAKANWSSSSGDVGASSSWRAGLSYLWAKANGREATLGTAVKNALAPGVVKVRPPHERLLAMRCRGSWPDEHRRFARALAQLLATPPAQTPSSHPAPPAGPRVNGNRGDADQPAEQGALTD